MELQTELSKHRNRTIELLAEKDAEIKGLQRLGAGKRWQGDSGSQDDRLDSDGEEHGGGDADWLSSGGGAPGGTGSGGGMHSCPLYQCCEAKARMEQELRDLRHQRRQLVMQSHKLQADAEYARADWAGETAALSSRLQRAEAINRLASGVNVEYLRNVLLRFLGSSDPSCKRLMAKAIGKVLQFSSEELAALQVREAGS